MTLQFQRFCNLCENPANCFSRGTIKIEMFERLKVYMQSKVLSTAYTLALADELNNSNSTVTVNIGKIELFYTYH